ncbi:hypothetical protein [Actinomadura rubrisoli]|uniref:Uncharacterized protein n=1 Tax=Actinomadura rubrisoli TaxID=2530368 RepID=A0A4R5BNE1_9ACTN|nr:hypothetical protein [Actinomadura rubrisoli]TDD88361.1 hypothetical protein E1298_15235 [Actinomadura rubrisoli]
MTERRPSERVSDDKAARQRALAAWFTEWSQQHDVDEVEDAPAAAQDQYWRRARELMGLDPESGLRPGITGRRRRRT